jgi:hypothetical protein
MHTRLTGDLHEVDDRGDVRQFSQGKRAARSEGLEPPTF